MTIALIGNQNCGKSTLFNRLTGSNQHVGNFPGVTVEKKEGLITGTDYVAVDLPGIYSLSPYSTDETITRNFLLRERPDCIINIVDVTNIERNLYLTLQLAQMNIPMVIALNFMDEFKGGEIDIKGLSDCLGIKVVPLSALSGDGIFELISSVKSAKPPQKLFPSPADMRYAFIEKALSAHIHKPPLSKVKIRSQKIDLLLTNKYLALPIFFCIMALIFYITFSLAGPCLSSLAERGIFIITKYFSDLLLSYNISPALYSLITDGIFKGVGSVLSFLPVIVILFFFLSLLEDSGYMARVAYIMDRLMSKLGLSGRAIVPLLIGFGCSVPAVMATRTLSDENERKMTVLLTPFMSCSAKIAIYAVFTDAFFTSHKALVMTGLYILGIVISILYALLLKKTVFYSKNAPFILELPPYRMPAFQSILLNMWDKAKGFVTKAFTVILLSSTGIWFLQNFDFAFTMTEDNSKSILASLGGLLAYIFKPLGFGDWRVSAALITGLSAKEAVISTLAVLMNGTPLQSIFSVPSALSFLVFTLLYMPCVAAFAAIKKELVSFTDAALAMIVQCAIAWTVSYIVYRIGMII